MNNTSVCKGTALMARGYAVVLTLPHAAGGWAYRSLLVVCVATLAVLPITPRDGNLLVWMKPHDTAALLLRPREHAGTPRLCSFYVGAVLPLGLLCVLVLVPSLCNSVVGVGVPYEAGEIAGDTRRRWPGAAFGSSER